MGWPSANPKAQVPTTTSQTGRELIFIVTSKVGDSLILTEDYENIVVSERLNTFLQNGGLLTFANAKTPTAR